MISAVPVRIIGDLLNAKTKAIPRTEPGMMKGNIVMTSRMLFEKNRKRNDDTE